MKAEIGALRYSKWVKVIFPAEARWRREGMISSLLFSLGDWEGNPEQ